MTKYREGDRVRIDIPDETDLDHESYHGRHGIVRAVLSDDADTVTNSQVDARIIRVEFDDGATADFRPHDLRPPFDN